MAGVVQTVDIHLLQPSPWEAPAEAAREWAPILKTLGDPTRLEIALLLVQKPHTVKELQDAMGLNQALVSHHLRLLREQGIVTAEARGRSNVYELCFGPLACLAQCLASIAASTPEGLQACAALPPNPA